MRRRFAAPLLALVLPAAALAGPPSPINPTYHALPGAVVHPASARSAGLALADRWLGDEPFGNPAVAGRRSVMLAGSLARTGRQDLVRQNRRFDDQSFFLDGAGGAVGGSFGNLGAALYAHQPQLRLEDHVFSRGTDATAEPATIANHSEAREMRAGLALSWNGGAWRAGAALEWTRRDDSYETVETSGAPQAGTRTASFAGSGMGGSAGAELRFGGDAPGGVRVGAAFRHTPELSLEGERAEDLAAGTASGIVTATREAGWEAGVTIETVVTPAFRAMLSAGGHGEQAWEGFGVTRGAGSEWSVGGEYHDARDPWMVRFGLGREEERGVPEPRARRLAIGATWLMDTLHLHAGVLHRTITRPGQPDSSDDRVLIGLTQTF